MSNPNSEFNRACTGKGVGYEDKFRIIKKDTKKVKLNGQSVWRKHGAFGYTRVKGGEI